MNDLTNEAAVLAANSTAPAATTAADPLAVFATSPKEKEGLSLDLEDPRTGEVLMRFRVARFGGSNSTKIVRVERELKSKLTQGQRRQIDAGAGDPDVVNRINRQTFIRVSILGFEPVHPALVDRFPAAEGAAAYETLDKLFEQYPAAYDAVTEMATDEEKWANDALEADLKN